MTREQIEADRKNVEQLFVPALRSKDLELLNHSLNYVSGMIRDYEKEIDQTGIRFDIRSALKYYRYIRDQFEMRIKKIQRANTLRSARLAVVRAQKKKNNDLVELYMAQQLQHLRAREEYKTKTIEFNLKQLLDTGYDPRAPLEDREKAIHEIMSRPDEQALETVKALEEYDRLKREASAEANPEDFMKALESEEPKNDVN